MRKKQTLLIKGKYMPFQTVQTRPAGSQVSVHVQQTQDRRANPLRERFVEADRADRAGQARFLQAEEPRYARNLSAVPIPRR